MRIWVAALGFVIATASACTTSGSLDLQLSLPDNADLAPTGMTTVTVVASSPDFGTHSTTSILTGRTFTADTLPIANNVQIDVLFHDDSNRLVGVGEAPNVVDIVGDKNTVVSIPMRRPFIYASSGTKLYTFDPTLDPRSTKFQGQLTGLTAPQVAISVGGDRLVVASTNQLQIIEHRDRQPDLDPRHDQGRRTGSRLAPRRDRALCRHLDRRYRQRHGHDRRQRLGR
jgi:hypothetical protein